MDLSYVEFHQVDLNDDFFLSLKQDYAEFEQWFHKKSQNKAYIHRAPNEKLDGFLYLKREDEAITDTHPPLPAQNRLKVGTFKIDAHGTRLGERFVKKIFDHAVHEGSKEIYVTVFEKHAGLISLLARYGFKQTATKTTPNGTELVLTREMSWRGNDLDQNYPLVRIAGSRQFLLSLYPKWHTRLLPDSILKTEDSDVIQDVSHANSIHKVYLSGMKNLDQLKRGDSLVIYRTTDEQGAAYYRSVATSICVVEEVLDISAFSNVDDFLKYCAPYSVFTEIELRGFYKTKKFPTIIRFTYNIALKKRPNRKALIEELGMEVDQYWGFFELNQTQFKAIANKGEVDESLIIS